MLSALQTTVLAAPAYQHVFLQVLASFSKLWSSCSVLRESFFTSASEHWEGLTHSKTLLEAIDATLTQLTGLPFPPFLRSLLHLFFDFNDVIDLFVAEMSSFLTQPLPLSVPEVYERHPATGMPYCPAEASTRVRIIMHRFHSLLQHQPLAASITKALARSRKVCEAITGNSAVLRFYRAFKRLAADLVQVDQSGTFQLLAEPDELAAVLRHIAQGLGRVSLEPISSNTEEGHIELRNVTFEATDIVPNHVSVSNATDWSFGNGIQQQIRVTLEGMHVDAPSVSFSYSKGSAGLPESGSADIHLAFDLRLLFSPGTGALPVFEHVAVKVKACDVSMKGTGKDTLYQLAWPLVRNTMVGHVQVAIEDFISSKLAFIFSRPDAEPITPLSKVLRAQSKSVASTPRTEGPTETYLSARARFRREITGITTSLQSGDLDNPLEDSVPSSPILPTGPKPRAGSMASYLSEAATADATDLKNIQRPPRARGASMAYALDSNSESDEEARPMSATSRRHTAPDAGMDIDAYEAAAQDLEHSEQQRRRMTMSATLSELTSRDTTTIDGVRNPPKHEKDDQPELPPTMQRNMSMDHVTRALSGLADRELASPNVAAKPMRASPMPMSPRPQGQPPAGLSRRKSMSEWLNDKAMQDHTQLSKPGGDYDVPHKHGVPTTTGPVEIPTKERRDSAMRRSLTDTSAVDGTVGSFFKTAPTKAHIGRKLPDNIASPPGSTSHSRASSFARSKPSFTGLKNRFSMAESLDAELEEDESACFTLKESSARLTSLPAVPGRALGRRKSSATSGPTGLSLEELRQRRQSFKLDDKATVGVLLAPTSP